MLKSVEIRSKASVKSIETIALCRSERSCPLDPTHLNDIDVRMSVGRFDVFQELLLTDTRTLPNTNCVVRPTDPERAILGARADASGVFSKPVLSRRSIRYKTNKLGSCIFD